MKVFSASLDKRSKWFTLLGFVFLLYFPLTFYNPAIENNIGYNLLIFFPVFVLGIAYLFHPVKYVINNDELIIKRPIKSYVIKISEIKEIKPLSQEEMSGTKRVFGSGGFFGYYGKFRNNNFGTMKFFATRYSDFVYILTAMGENIILTPDDVEGFVEEITKQIK